jgi:Streptomyces sporulation and cell division protein, SsgA
MMESGTTVSAELGLMLVVPQHTTVPLVASLFYSGEDPYAVRMAFHVGTDEPVEWIFARDLLSAGMTGPSGEGDVKVWPSSGDGDATLNIVLSSPFGQAHFEAPAAAMAEFLRRTYDAIPVGREGDFFDIEGELDGLLWQA